MAGKMPLQFSSVGFSLLHKLLGAVRCHLEEAMAQLVGFRLILTLG